MEPEENMSDKLVEEKQESTGTIAKAGLFWAILAIPLILWRKLRRRR